MTAAKFLFDEMLDLVGDLDYLVFHIVLTVTFASFQEIPTRIMILRYIYTWCIIIYCHDNVIRLKEIAYL